MAFERFFNDITQVGSSTEFKPLFGVTSSTLSLIADLGSLSGEAEPIVRWVRYKFGEPRVTCELDNLQIYSAFEEANIEFSAIVNKSQAADHLMNLLGESKDFKTKDYTGKLPHNTMDYLRRLGAGFATEANVGGVQSVRRAYLSQTTTATDYNLLTDFIDEKTGSSCLDYVLSVSGGRIDVRQVWYPEPSTVYRYFDPYSSTNVLAQEFQYESYSMESIFQIYPIWTDILRAGMLETNDRVRRSNISYHIWGDRIRLLPKPNRNLRIWIEYTVDMDPFNPDFSVPGGDPSVNGISNIANIPFKDHKYEDVNSFGKRWIRQMTFAISMETLGRIRRKFGTVPIPGSEITLDGSDLVGEGIAMQDKLRDELKADFEATNITKLLEQETQESEFLEQQYSRIPFPAPIMMY